MEPVLDVSSFELTREVDPPALQLHEAVAGLLRILIDELRKPVQFGQAILVKMFGSHDGHPEWHPESSNTGLDCTVIAQEFKAVKTHYRKSAISASANRRIPWAWG
jgi:hypothetical protein